MCKVCCNNVQSVCDSVWDVPLRPQSLIAWTVVAPQGLMGNCIMRLAVVMQVYSVSVSPFFGVQAPGPSPQLHGDLGINFSCSPANTHHLIEAAVNEVHRLQACSFPPPPSLRSTYRCESYSLIAETFGSTTYCIYPLCLSSFIFPATSQHHPLHCPNIQRREENEFHTITALCWSTA